jgi:hypothetical protein
LFRELLPISLDKKAFKKGHNYATILIGSQRDYVVEMAESRSEKDVKSLFYCVNLQEKQPQLQRVNIDMWKTGSAGKQPARDTANMSKGCLAILPSGAGRGSIVVFSPILFALFVHLNRQNTRIIRTDI